VIQNWIWQLKQTPDVERALRRPLEIIERNTELQARLMEDLLDVSQSAHGKLHVQTQLVDLAQVCGLVVEQCQMAAHAKRIRLEFVRTTSPHIWGDPIRLQQVVWNVLNNAVKFTPENGRIQIRVSRGPRHACITVEDSGIGVEPQFLPRMFERFTQADSTPTRRFGGLGVGLSIVKDIVTLHGGSVRADSRGAFQGTSITIEFPIPALMDQPRAWLSETGARQQSAGSLRGMEILHVDDDVDTLTAVENVLRHHGADVFRAASTREALALLEQRAPTLMIADLSMPDSTGLDLIKHIRRLATPRSRLPAAVLSAHAASEHATSASEAGFQIYIEKPVAPDVFVGHIATLAGRH
jgi:CheY-like chemotaxis protein